VYALAVITTLVAVGCAQPASATKPSFTPIFDRDGHALTRFHRSLRRTAGGIGQTRILQYGASHTEADIFTGYLRQFFQNRFGDAGHGYIMPARPWRGYRHMDAQLESSDGWFTDKAYRRDSRKDGLYGLAGFSVSSADKADFGAVATSKKSAFGKNVSRFEVFYLRQTQGGSFDISVDGNHYMRVRTGALELGLGVRSIRVQDGPHRLEIRPVGDGEVRLLGTVMERGAPGVVVDSLGIRGARASVHLRWNEALWRAQIRRRAPDLVLLAYGTNEAGDTNVSIKHYESQLSKVLERLRVAVPNASCVLVGPTDRPVKRRRGKVRHRPRTDDIIRSQRRIGARYRCGFWDSVRSMGGPLSIVRWHRADPPLARKDYVHLTTRGYFALADDLARALLHGYDRQ